MSKKTRRISTREHIDPNLPEAEQRKLIDEWFTKHNGFEQMKLNITATATNYAAYKDDLLGYVMAEFYKLPVEKMVKINNEAGIENYMSRVAGLSIKSNSSPFHSQYRKFSLKSREQFDATSSMKPLWYQEDPTDYSEDLCVRCMKMEIAKLDFYESMLVNAMVFNGYKPKKFAEENNLDVVSVTNNFYSVKKKLQKACKNYR